MINKIKSFEDLEIWKFSHSLVLEIYKVVKSFPKSEDYILHNKLLDLLNPSRQILLKGWEDFLKKNFYNS